jgi:hypothetical protein
MKITKPMLMGFELLLAIGAYLIHPVVSIIVLLMLIATWGY